MKKFLKFTIPLAFLLLGIGLLVSFELYFKDKINTTQVIVAKEDIDFKEKITEENTQIISIRKDNAVADVIEPKDIDLILDKNASVSIKKNTQIYSELIDSYDLIPNEKKGEFIAPIPDEWLFAVPGSLRKTFIADFYAIPDKEQAVIKALVQDSVVQHEETEKSAGEEKPLKSSESTDLIIKKANEPILQDVRVASVKDGSNKEVKETEESKDAATGSVSELEVIADGEMLQVLRDYTERGFKIYVVYKYDRS